MELDKAPGYGEIGYWVAKEARGKGVATRAVTLLRDWAATELGLRADRAAHPRGQRAVDRASPSAPASSTPASAARAPRQEGATALDHAVYAWSPA